jgi:hypothetical protein
MLGYIPDGNSELSNKEVSVASTTALAFYRASLFFLFATVLLLATACQSSQTPAPAARTQTASAESDYRPVSTIKDIMDAMVDYNSDWLWDAVSIEYTAKGIIDKRPRTDDDWKEARKHAIALLEASNLLLMPGRAVARPGEKSENPGIEEEPEQIKALIDADRARWVTNAHGLFDSAKLMLDAIDKKDSEQLLDLGDQLDQACEKCHMYYWYPHQFDAQRGTVPAGAGSDPNHEFSDRFDRKKSGEKK